MDAFAVEYKEQREEWTQAKRRVWPASKMFRKTGLTATVLNTDMYFTTFVYLMNLYQNHVFFLLY